MVRAGAPRALPSYSSHRAAADPTKAIATRVELRRAGLRMSAQPRFQLRPTVRYGARRSSTPQRVTFSFWSCKTCTVHE